MSNEMRAYALLKRVNINVMTTLKSRQGQTFS